MENPEPSAPADRPLEVSDLMDAGATAVEYNTPMGAARVDQLARWVHDARHLVDLGCGQGALVVRLAQLLPRLSGLGIDLDAGFVARARARSRSGGVAERVSFTVGDIADWSGPADTVLCLGATHVFDSLDAFWARMRTASVRRVVVGDGYFAEPPDTWLRETFGDLPVGLDALAAPAVGAGWDVTATDCSTLDEWDEFEHRWIAGVESVGTDAAQAFAASRREDYEERYRGRLGFGWVLAIAPDA
ncbi:MAG: methyltransferase domain-containing protein [Actinomycetota bacterium]|nr:methyltransferase domain-containing protein [Actinomycetota bacterium]